MVMVPSSFCLYECFKIELKIEVIDFLSYSFLNARYCSRASSKVISFGRNIPYEENSNFRQSKSPSSVVVSNPCFFGLWY